MPMEQPPTSLASTPPKEEKSWTRTHFQYELSVPVEELDLRKFAFYSVLAFFIETLSCYPLDVKRVRVQAAREPSSFTLLQQFKDRGIRSLYRGYLMSLWQWPSFGAYILTYNYVKEKLQGVSDRYWPNEEHRTALWATMGGACLADVVCAILICPVDVVVQRLQLSEVGQANATGFATTMHIWRTAGLRGFYEGWGATLLTYVPASLVWWPTYEYCKEVFSRYIAEMQQAKSEDNKVVVGQHKVAQMASGVLAGFCTVIVSNPFDVVKTRLQTQRQQLASERVKRRKAGQPKPQGKFYSNSWEAIIRITREEGVGAFAKGFSVLYELLLEYSRISPPTADEAEY